jgi:4-amino-4-deoxy-L-arabinose transferase-like glycosyltransferase
MAGLFALALAVRLLYLFEASSGPAFLVPLVDAETYHRVATALASGEASTDALFWQPVFYPLFLSVLYKIVGPSVVAARIVQAVLGAVTAALTYRLGRRAMGHGVGVVAGAIVALYGPLVFFDTELVRPARSRDHGSSFCWASRSPPPR